MDPLVSFVVPCYKFGHFLKECVDSILLQTYPNFEVLIMDDCSPDNTPEIARGFHDLRVKHIRNECNLGHLRNYNKGIGLSRGKYVWLMSADDKLRVVNVLERYVTLMESHPNVGYVFCPGVVIKDGVETRTSGSYGTQDWILKGHDFLLDLLNANCIVASSGMVRRQCYDRCSLFPADLPCAGDWFLWCIFAVPYEVAYLSEPMVNYRVHGSNMTKSIMEREWPVRAKEDFLVLWRVKEMSQKYRQRAVVEKCEHLIAYQYVNGIASETCDPHCGERFQLCAEWLDEVKASRADQRIIRARLYACAGDHQFWRRAYAQAFRSYMAGLEYDPSMLTVWLKCLATPFGGIAVRLRRFARDRRRRAATRMQSAGEATSV